MDRSWAHLPGDTKLTYGDYYTTLDLVRTVLEEYELELNSVNIIALLKATVEVQEEMGSDPEGEVP